MPLWGESEASQGLLGLLPGFDSGASLPIRGCRADVSASSSPPGSWGSGGVSKQK